MRGIEYSLEGNQKLVGYVDANHATCEDVQFQIEDSECDDRSNDQYIMNGQKKQSLNCGLSGRASGGPLFIHLSIYPISVPVDMCN